MLQGLAGTHWGALVSIGAHGADVEVRLERVLHAAQLLVEGERGRDDLEEGGGRAHLTRGAGVEERAVGTRGAGQGEEEGGETEDS